MDLRLYDLREDDFDRIIALGDNTYGPGYVDRADLAKIHRSSCVLGLCCSKVMYDKPREKGKLVGFRLTYAPGRWEIDERCSPDQWGINPEKVCYFKSNTIDPAYRGKGIGSILLDVSKQTAQYQGAEAGVAHIWLGSPGNSAFRYFVKNGGQLVWVWPNCWTGKFRQVVGDCTTCGTTCSCSAVEMILHFGESSK